MLTLIIHPSPYGSLFTRAGSFSSASLNSSISPLTGYGLDGLYRTENFVLAERFAYSGNINEYDVAELALCEVGDADECFVTFHPYPFVVVGILEISRYVHC